MKILLISPSWVGDAVIAQSLYKRLRENDSTVSLFSDFHLGVLIKAKFGSSGGFEVAMSLIPLPEKRMLSSSYES